MNETSTQQTDEGVWNRLRRRKVVQWSVAYVAAAWALLQGLQFLSATYDWPSTALRIVTLGLALGLPIASTLAWYHGDRGVRRVSGTELTIVALLLLLGGGIVWYYQRVAETSAVVYHDPPSSAALATDASIAVLPFVNMSTDKDQEFFADGISEELLNLLAQVPELRVIARTSSFSFKGKDVDIADIARRLNVANVLEGSVRKSGDTLRITAQLVRASDSSHLWSKTYDRQMTDVFKVQDEIAGAVVAELKIKLLGAAPTARTTNPEAYALYLQARQLGRQGTAEAYAKSDTLYQQVLALDPHYAPAWDGLAVNYINETGIGVLSNQEGFARAREAAQKALAIDPDYALAHASSGWIAMYGANDPAAAAPHFERALALDPSDLEVLRRAANLLPLLGRLDEALALQEAIVRRDPVNVKALFNLGFSQRQAGRFDAAIASQRTALSLSPGGAQSQFEIGVALLLKGEASAALAEIEQEASEVWRLIGLPMAYHALGRHADADTALAALIAKYGKDWAYNIAYVQAFRGDADQAFAWLDKAVAYQDPGIGYIVPENLFANIRSDPRWLPFLRKIGRAPEQLAAIKFDVTVPR